MKIGVIGAGNIGGTIGRKWALADHDVTFGVRDISSGKLQDLLKACEGKASADSVANAIQEAEVVLFAIPGRAMEETASPHGAQLDGKILIDASNQIGEGVMNSLATLKEHAPTAKLYRAFNNLGWENFEEPTFGDEQADLYYCGDEGEAQEVVEGLIADVGIRPVYVGGTELASLIDAITGLWFALALRQGRGRHLAFRMLED